jgi:hypothetical protein
MATAIFNTMTPAEHKANPLPTTNNQRVNSGYWHPLLLGHCPAP